MRTALSEHAHQRQRSPHIATWCWKPRIVSRPWCISTKRATATYSARRCGSRRRSTIRPRARIRRLSFPTGAGRWASRSNGASDSDCRAIKKWDDIIARLSPLPVAGRQVRRARIAPGHLAQHRQPARSSGDADASRLFARRPGRRSRDDGAHAGRRDANVGLGDQDLGLGLSDDRDDGGAAWAGRIWRWKYCFGTDRTIAILRTAIVRRGATRHAERAPLPARKREIAAYLPANGAFLSAVALMVAGWDGCSEPHPGHSEGRHVDRPRRGIASAAVIITGSCRWRRD